MTGRFCGRCGQERKTLRVAFHRLAGEAIAESLTLDSKLARTLATLVARPGEATRAYLAGRRASQTSPVKLYLLLSFLYFFAGALAPDRVDVAAAERPAGAEGLTAEDPGLRELRESGGLGARLADRVEAIARTPPAELKRRMNAAFSENAPKAMFFLVPVLAVLLQLFFRHAGLYFAEHVVVALHVHAVAFLFLVPGALAGSGAAMSAGWLASSVHAVAAMRRVYERSWAATLGRALAIGSFYVVALGMALLVAVGAALLSL